MVSAKQGKRRSHGVQNGGRRFKASMRSLSGNLPPAGAAAPLSNSYVRMAINPLFTASQIPDNPGYVDFNEPTPPPVPNNPPKVNTINAPSTKHRYPRRCHGGQGNKSVPHRNQNGNHSGWNPGCVRVPPNSMNVQHPMRPPPPPPYVGRDFRNGHMPPLRGGRPPLPPPAPPIRAPPIILPPAPPNMNSSGRFGPRPRMPPIGCPRMPPPPPPSMRISVPGGLRPVRNRNDGPLAGGGSMGPLRRGKMISNNRRPIKGRKRNNTSGPSLPVSTAAGGSGVMNGKAKKSITIKKTLNEIVNQYPLDKPWVTDEIREEQKKKQEIENKLKGNKDDKLFAEFKVQRDKFVKMYEAARLEYIGKHPEQDIEKIMTESDKTKGETNANKEKPNENQNTMNDKKPATT